MKQVLGELKIARILSGGAKGADQVAERYAKENNIPIEVFLPNWKEYWKAAGPIRNTQMVELADVIVAFWDGTSPGTKHTITRAKQFHKHVYIIR